LLIEDIALQRCLYVTRLFIECQVGRLRMMLNPAKWPYALRLFN
jgi:hypothetical protein